VSDSQLVSASGCLTVYQAAPAFLDFTVALYLLPLSFGRSPAAMSLSASSINFARLRTDSPKTDSDHISQVVRHTTCIDVQAGFAPFSHQNRPFAKIGSRQT
jgi:hypothetical protein